MSRDPPDAGPPTLMDASNRLLHVYGKTPAGTAALRADRGAMPTQARRILILIDGKRSIGDLARIFPVQTLETALAFLDEQRYIECLQHFAPGDPGSDAGVYGREFTTTARPGPLSHLQRRHYLLGLAALISLALLAYAYDSMSSRPPPPPVRPAAAHAQPSPAAPAAAAPASGNDAAPGAGAAAPTSMVAPAAAPVLDAAVVPLAPDAAPPSPARPAAAPAAPNPAAKMPEATTAAAAAEKTADKASDGAAATASEESLAARARKAARRVLQASVAPEAPPPAGGLRKVPVLPGFIAPAPHANVAPSPDAAPAAAAAPAAPAAPGLRVRSQVQPQLPQQARDLGISSGRVVVVLHVNPGGTVDSVELVSATPPQVFDESMRHAFEDWTFDPPGVPGRMTVEIVVGAAPGPAQP